MSSYDKAGPLDGAIDKAVREMVALDPRPGLRQRVTRSIKTPSRRTFDFRFGLGAAGLVMVAVVAVIMLRPSNPATPVHAPQVAVTPTATAPPRARPQAAEASAAPAAVPPSAMPPSAGQLSAVPVRPRARVTPTPESIFGPRQGKVAAANVPPSRLTSAAKAFWSEVPVGAARQAAIAPITFQPILVAPLAIQPLFVAGSSPRK